MSLDGNVTVYEEQIVVVTNDTPTQVHVSNDVTNVITEGKQGPPGTQGPIGPVGPGASGAIEINFAFGDATPAILVTAPAGKLIFGVSLHIRVPFDGAGASLTVGDAGDLDRLMTAVENVPTSVGSNTTNPAYAYGVDTQLLLSITAGAGATQGSGLATIYIQQ